MATARLYGRMRYIDSGLREAKQTVGCWMTDALATGVREVRCQAGYFTLDGAGLLLPVLKTCAAEGAAVRLLLGSNGGATLASHIAFLAGALGVPQKHVSLGVVSFDTSLFHPKVYHFVRENGSQTAYVGSANLTGPGVSGMNVEAGVILDTEDGDDASVLHDIVASIESWFEGGAPGLSAIATARDIDVLLAAGIIALKPTKRSVEPEEEGKDEEPRRLRPLARLRPIFSLPVVEQQKRSSFAKRQQFAPMAAAERIRFVHNTEASFHYPQGVHLGHILSILWYFSGDRKETPFDDEFIRLKGSLGAGRIAAYRRQIKYKMLAAMELGLIADIRLAEDATSFTPELTEDGRSLWFLLSSFTQTKDLIYAPDADGAYSATMPQKPHFYNNLIKEAQRKSEDVRVIFQSVFLNMPAVKQMLKYLYTRQCVAVVKKAFIYENFFQFEPVQNFCDAMGIEPATSESAKHRCPFLLNILECCGILEQGQFDVTIKRLAVDTDILVAEGEDRAAGEKILPVLIAEWGSGSSSLPEQDQKNLRELFGETFLTARYHLEQILRIPE